MLEKYYRIDKAVGVGITILPNGGLQIDACSIVIDNSQLNFDEKVTGLYNMEALKEHFPFNSFIALNLSGKGILHKQIERTARVDQNNFNKVLPNADIDDFYVQNFISGDSSFVSVVRKTDADKWIGQLKVLGLVPLMLSLGPFPVQNITAQLNVYDLEVIFNGHIIQRNETSDWIAYQYSETAFSPFPLKIESEGINEKLVVPYAAAFQLVLASKVELIKADVAQLETAFTEIIADKKFKVQSFLVLSVFFILLLVNFIIFSWLNSSNNKLASQISLSAQNNINIEGINEQVKQKEALLKDLGWDGGINKSALVDQLASLLSAELTWSQIEVNPIDISSSRIQKSLVFFDREIRVTGKSDKIIPVNEWIARVKTKTWVKNIQLDSYSFSNELNTGQFIVIINY